MLTHFLRFEVRYWLKGWMVWIFLLIIAALIWGATSSDNVQVGSALPNTNRNSPYVVQNFYAVMGILSLLMTAAFVNNAAARDFAYNTWQMLFTTPVRRRDFLLGRFLGAAFVSVIPLLGVSLGVLLAPFAPWADGDRFGPLLLNGHLQGLLTMAIPNTLLIAAIIFAVAAWTRSTVTSFLAGLLLIVLYTVAGSFLSDMKDERIAMLLDPFGIRTFALMTKYWTVSERNQLAVGWEGMMLWNRLLWLGVAAVIFGVSAVRFQFTERTPRRWFRRKPRALAVEMAMPVSLVPSALPVARPSRWAQFAGAWRTEFFGLVKTTSFIVIVAGAMLNMTPSLIMGAGGMYGLSTFPVTYRILEMIAGTLYLFSIGIITYFAGVLVWKERDARMDEIHDAAPHPSWINFAAKFTALLGALLIIQFVAMLVGIGVQTWYGYRRYQLGVYTLELFFLDFSMFFFFALLAFVFHVLSPNKYIGYFAFVTYLVVMAFVKEPLNIATRMVDYGDRPSYVYSDFYGYAPFISTWSWFTVYWAAFAAILALATLYFWQRGRETDWRHRWRMALTRMNRPLFAGVVWVFVALAGWVYYNTKVLNTLRGPKDVLQIGVDYEKTYKKYEKLPQPRITSVRYTIDLFPERRAMKLVADHVIRNKTNAPIGEVHFNMNGDFDQIIELANAKVKLDDERLGYRIYQLAQPMQPGEERPMRLTAEYEPKGFANGVGTREIMQNGTFFNHTIVPQIGYQDGDEVSDRNDRRKYGLKEKNLMPVLERNCTANCGNTYLSNNSDWVDVESVISTAPDQIAIAPGSLQREWTEKGRRYFQYKLDHTALNFYSFLSARYEVAREEWNGVKLEVYYHHEHAWNVPKMMKSLRRSLEYYSQEFGPYTHKQARIIEFPRVATFAQAFPGTMPYSESIGFIARIDKPDDIDMVFYVVAHEMAHQWWAHQVIGANMQGGTLLSETLAQYSALMVMEKEYGRDQMRKFLEYEMDRYLRSRGSERLQERPLLTVEGQQGYIHYQKGSVIMYYLKEMIGEAAVNRALKKVVAQWAYQGPPYATSHVLVDALREETPENLRYLINDLFEQITLFSNRTLLASAKKRADGQYDVTIEVESKKFKADAKGVETELPVQDLIEIGAFAEPEKGKKYGKLLHRERVAMKSGKHKFTFVTKDPPAKAGIDPLAMLVDRVPDDNLKKVDVS